MKKRSSQMTPEEIEQAKRKLKKYVHKINKIVARKFKIVRKKGRNN